MRGSSAGDDVAPAGAIEVGGEGVFAGHAAVVDGVAIEGRGGIAGSGIEYENAGPARHGCRRTIRVALADHDLVVGIGIEIGAPDGMTPLHRLGDDLAVPEPAAR